jgi:hypothetical protein
VSWSSRRRDRHLRGGVAGARTGSRSERAAGLVPGHRRAENEASRPVDTCCRSCFARPRRRRARARGRDGLRTGSRSRAERSSP